VDRGLHCNRHRTPITYRLIQLAPGSYDLLLGEMIVASVVKSSSGKAVIWTAELLDGRDEVRRPEPFTRAEHDFASLGELRAWLGNPEVQPTRRDGPML